MIFSISFTISCRILKSSSEMPCSFAASRRVKLRAANCAGEGGGSARSSFSSCFSWRIGGSWKTGILRGKAISYCYIGTCCLLFVSWPTLPKAGTLPGLTGKYNSVVPGMRADAQCSKQKMSFHSWQLERESSVFHSWTTFSDSSEAEFNQENKKL